MRGSGDEERRGDKGQGELSSSPDPLIPSSPEAPAAGGEGKGAEKLRWQRLLLQATEPLFVLNRQRRILFVNPAWEGLTGVSLPQARGHGVAEQAEADDAD